MSVQPEGHALTPAPVASARARVPGAPRLTAAQCELLREIQILDEYGERRSIHIPAERPLTIFVDKRELVTLMTLGQCPELLVLGYLCNQRLITSVQEVESITVDWDVGAAAGVFTTSQPRPPRASSPPVVARARCSAMR
jgi:FdhD protein